MGNLREIGRFLRVAVVAALCFTSLVPAAPAAFAAEPADPLYKEQWYLKAVGAPGAWDVSKGSPTVTVAVLDSGVDLTHPDLAERIWTNPREIPGNGIDDDRNGYVDDVHGWDFIGDDADPNPDIGLKSPVDGANHGTLVAGIIGAAGSNGIGIAGVAWNVRILPLRVLDENGAGNTQGVVRAIRYAVAAGARIVNISFTGSKYNQALADALRAARDAGVLVVAAAGNEGDTERGGDLNVYPSYPACYRDASGERVVLAVAALDANGVKSSFSSYGSDCVGISAPGERFFSTQVYRPAFEAFREPYGDSWSGSSLAAPVVSGVAALLASMDPSLDADGLRAYLRATAKDVNALNGPYAGHLGAGQVDAAAAVRAVQAALLGGGAPSAPTETEAVGGRLIKLSSSSAVYYLGADGRRYVFPNEKTFRSWFPVAPPIRTIPAAEMASYPLGGNVTYRPGVRMLKIQTDPKIYAVGKDGLLRHVTSEAVAEGLYGPAWNTHIDDISEAFFVNYRVGPPIATVLDYDPEAERTRVPTIDRDKSLLSGRN